MIANLYKNLKDCKDFYERCEEPVGNLAIPMSYEELKFVYNLVELAIMLTKLSGEQKR